MPKPKKAKDLISRTAKSCDVSEETTSDVVDFFYAELARKIHAMKHPYIRIPILGSMRLSRVKMERSMKQIKGRLDEKEQKGETNKWFYLKQKQKYEHIENAYNTLNNVNNEVAKRRKDLGKS